jgi:hypothetical protein
MSGKRRGRSDTTPLLPLPHFRSSASSFLEMAASTAAASDSVPLRSVFLGVDVGTGSARAGPLSLALSTSTIFVFLMLVG